MALNFAEVANNKKATPKKAKAEVIALAPKTFDIVAIQKHLEQYRPKLEELEKQAEDLKVTDNETFQMAVDGAGTAKGFIKAIEGEKGKETERYREYVNKVNNAAKFFTDTAKRVAEIFSRKSGDYQYKLQLAEREQQKKIEEANRKLQEDLDKQAKETGVEAPTVIPVKAPKPETVIHTAGGHSQHLRKQWVGEIDDPEKVPRNYCVPDQRLINNAVKMGVRSIEGVKIFEKVSAVHR